MPVHPRQPEHLRNFEVAAAELRGTFLLPLVEEATRDAIQLTWGDEVGVVALLSPEAVEIRLPTIDWIHGAYGPKASSRLWRRIRIRHGYSPEEIELVQETLAAGLAKRKAEFMPCRFCGEPTPPERRTVKACHGCASLHSGVVY